MRELDDRRQSKKEKKGSIKGGAMLTIDQTTDKRQRIVVRGGGEVCNAIHILNIHRATMKISQPTNKLSERGNTRCP